MSDVQQYSEPAASELEQWGRDAHLIAQVAVNLVKTSFVPASYGGDPAQVVAAILTGQEIGIKPMAALRSMDIIQGVPAVRAIAMRALVQSHGHDIWTAESTAERCVVRAQRKGSDKVEQSVWSLDRARPMGLLSKDNWRKQPTAMLLARATAEVARLVAADVLLGVPYSIEEIQDQAPDVEATSATKKPAARAAMKRATLPVVEPPLPTEQPAAQHEDEVEQLPVDAVEQKAIDAYVDERASDGDRQPDRREPVRDWPVVPIPTDADAPPVDEPELDWGDSS